MPTEVLKVCKITGKVKFKKTNRKHMHLGMILAVSANGVIGVDGKLPWHLPADLKHFKEVTSGGTVIMGRKTYESIGKPLPNRLNIVMTRDKTFSAPGVEVVHSEEELFQKIKTKPKNFIIGGAEIYEMFEPFCSELHITKVLTEVDTSEGEVTKLPSLLNILDIWWVEKTSDRKSGKAVDDTPGYSINTYYRSPLRGATIFQTLEVQHKDLKEWNAKLSSECMLFIIEEASRLNSALLLQTNPYLVFRGDRLVSSIRHWKPSK